MYLYVHGYFVWSSKHITISIKKQLHVHVHGIWLYKSIYCLTLHCQWLLLAGPVPRNSHQYIELVAWRC